jgi:hypothetical protein
MPQAYEALIDEHGSVRILEPVRSSAARRALVIVLDEAPAVEISKTTLPSEDSLAQDWNRPEEDEAWYYLQKVTE